MNEHERQIARIRIHGHYASIDYMAFQAIADVPLYPAATWAAPRAPGLTLRTLVRLAAQRSGPHDGVFFPAGLVKRVASFLEDHGWEITVLCPPQMPYPPGNIPLRTAIEWAGSRPHTLVQLPEPSKRLRFIASLREQFPDVHILIVATNKLEAKWLARRLRQKGLPVTWGIEPRTGDPWTHVDSVGTFEGRSVQDWGLVIFWDVELVLSLTSLMQITHMSGSARIGFLTRDERKLNELDRAIVESIFGPTIYRPGDGHNQCAEISVAWLPATAYPASQPESQLERKRDYFWGNFRRTAMIAAAAAAFSKSDVRAVAGMGLDDAAYWLSRRDSGVNLASSGPPTVAVVVENLEHARAIEKLLLGWRLASENNFTSPAPHLAGNVIVTLSLAARLTLTEDVVIHAAGIGEAWFDKLGLACPGVTGEKMLVVDVADDFDKKAIRDAKARRADYRRRGWIATTSKP